MELNEKKVYFIRGFGLGLIIAVLLFSIYPTKLNESEIREEAKKLGLVEEKEINEKKLESLIARNEDGKIDEDKVPLNAEATVEPNEELDMEPTMEPTLEPTVEPTVKPTAKPTVEPTAKPTVEPTIKPTAEPVVEKMLEQAEESTAEPTKETQVIVVLEIKGGMSSEAVARLLEENGLVDSAKSFNKFLVSSGYANKIKVGTVKIPKGVDYETVAKALD